MNCGTDSERADGDFVVDRFIKLDCMNGPDVFHCWQSKDGEGYAAFTLTNKLSFRGSYISKSLKGWDSHENTNGW